jgi:hypothetical protein
MARQTQKNSFSEDEEQKEYLEQRKTFIDLQHQVSQSLDKMVITLAGGALGLSFTFIRQVVPEAKAETIGLLATSWVLLVIALLSTFLSVFTSQVGMIKATEELDIIYGRKISQQRHQHILKSVCSFIGKSFNSTFGWRPLTQILNFVAIVLTIVGLIFLIIFGVQNIALTQYPLPK